MCRRQRLKIVGKKPERARVQSQKKQSALEISTWEKKKHSAALGAHEPTQVEAGDVPHPIIACLTGGRSSGPTSLLCKPGIGYGFGRCIKVPKTPQD